MKKKLVIRDSKYELMRIISMFMIVLWHIIEHGFLIQNTTGPIYTLLRILQAIIVVHVNSFILVMGYYQCKSKFKFSKWLSINNATWFYRIIILAIFIGFNIMQFSKVDILRNIFPLDLYFYYFIDLYLILYCLSPFLNILIEKMNQKTFQKLLIVLFILFSLITSFTNQGAFPNSGGRSIITFMFLYFIGAYFRLYKINIWEYFKVESTKIKRIVYASLFFFFACINILLYFFGVYLSQFGQIPQYIGNTFMNMTYSYDNPFIMLGSIMYFLWFGCLSMNNRFINKLGSLTLGVYLIHENPYIATHIYELFNLKINSHIDSYMIFPKILLIGVIVFVVCIIIEWIRQLLFKLVRKMFLHKDKKEEQHVVKQGIS